MQCLLIKGPRGHLVPLNDEEREKTRKLKAGVPIKCEVKLFRNYKFHKKFFALMKIAFDLWAESTIRRTYNGQQVMPDFDVFRKDVTKLAGFYVPVYSPNGNEIRIEAESIAWDSMKEERFEKLYSATINCILQKILPETKLTEQELREWAFRICEFDN